MRTFAAKPFNNFPMYSAEEVLKSVSRDLRKRGITHAAAAQMLGYKNRQTLSNLLSSKNYMSGLQAARFNKSFGYSIMYLTSGEGELLDDDTIRYDSYRESSPKEYLTMEPGASELGLLRQYFRRIIEAWGNPKAKKVLETYKRFESCFDISSLMTCMGVIERTLVELENEAHNYEQSR